MRLITLLNTVLFSFLLSGCATPRYLPAFGNAKANCDPVWSTHVPADVANNYINAKLLEKYAEILKENPSYIDRFFPSPSTIDSLGRNGTEIGLGTAAVISSISGNNLGAVIGSAVTAGLRSVTGLRSEDKTQDRQDACLPRDAVSMVLVTEDVKMLITKDPQVSLNWAKDMEHEAKKHEPEENEGNNLGISNPIYEPAKQGVSLSGK